MPLYHTSPEEIKKIHGNGRFRPGLFFSSEPYYMSQKQDTHLYEYEPEDDEIIDASSFPYLEQDEYKKIQHIVKDAMNHMGVDEETALEFISQNKNPESFYNDLENEINSMDEEDESYPKKKQVYNAWSKKDLGELGWDLQREALKAANFLGKKGVALPDETGISYLINLIGNEHKLKKHEK